MSTLRNTLDSFKDLVNNNEKVKLLFKNWNPNIVIEESLENQKFTMVIKDQGIQNVLEGAMPSDHQISIEAEEDVLIEVFSGESNPAEVVLDGQMAVYGSDSDQIKLDAISLIIWGM